MQQKQQPRPISERKQPKGSGESQSDSDSERNERENTTKSMNFNDILHDVNTAPHGQYEEMVGWPLSPVASSQTMGATNIFARYKYAGLGKAGDSGSIPAMHCFEAQGEPSSLTKEEQATDTSYTMLLASNRNASSTAAVDGKIQEPHLNDILCGRGGSINSHPGNRVFRGWVIERKESYNLAESKADKSRITSEILQRVRDQNPPGRFLQKAVEGTSKSNDLYSISGWWAEVDHIKALAKISQALREGAPAFRAQHGKKGHKKQKSPSAQRTSSTRSKNKNSKHKKTHELSPGQKRKAPPRTKSPQGVKHEETTSSPMSIDAGGHELDVLFPTTNNIFASSNPNGGLLDSYPLVHMGDYTASMDEVAAAVPPTPPTVKKQKADVPQAMVKPPGKCTTPNFGPSPNTPLVSPGFSPYGEAKAAWDAISFLPNLSSTPGILHSPLRKRPSLQRVHSLSFSDGDLHSIGSFNNPFENDNHGNHRHEQPPGLELEVSERNEELKQGKSFPPPPSATPTHGLSFGNIGSVPGGSRLHNSIPRKKKGTSRSSSLSSKSCGSISNLNNSKRKSIS